MAERKKLTKVQREEIYKKFDGHCAYCGRAIDYKDMQVDHIVSVHSWNEQECGADDMDNLFPACRSCNHYKRAHSVEYFRKMISEIPSKLARDNYIYKVGCNYGFFDSWPRHVEFYFEKVKFSQLNDLCNELKEKFNVDVWHNEDHVFRTITLNKFAADESGNSEAYIETFYLDDMDEVIRIVREWLDQLEQEKV